MLWSVPEEGLGTGGLGKEVWFTFGAENATVIDVLYFGAYFFFLFLIYTDLATVLLDFVPVQTCVNQWVWFPLNRLFW